MARSYFSRLVRGGEGALLAPPRPVSNLWKTALIGAAAAALDGEPLSTSQRYSKPSVRAADPVPPHNPATVESRPALPLRPVEPVGSGSRTRASQASVSGETVRPTPVAATSAKAEATRQDVARRERQGQAGQALQARQPESAATTVDSSAPTFSARREPTTPPAGPTPDARRFEAKPIPTEARQPGAVEPVPPVARPAAQRQPTPVYGSARRDKAAEAEHAAQAFPIPAPVAEGESPAGRPQAHLQPIEWATPMRSREPSRPARQSATPQEPRANGNTVQIGKIEVQVVPPPVSSYRPAPPAQPKVRLARGYSLWQGY